VRSRLIGAWLTAIFLLAALETAIAQPQRVLLLHSFGAHFEPWNAIAARFREELLKQSPHPIDLYETSLQGERFEQSQNDEPFVDYLRALFADPGLGLVVAMGAPAARFFLRNRPRIFPSTPMLIAGVDERTFDRAALTSNDTAVTSSVDQATAIENILRLLPNTANIAVAIGSSPMDKFWLEQYRRAFQPFADRVHFDWLNELSLDEMVKRVAALPRHSAIYYAQVHVDARGVPQEEGRALSRLHKTANAPIFSYIDSNFGSGIVGGPLLSTQRIAQQSAAVAVRILNGETAGNIKTPTLGPSAPIYDWRELQRWHISEAVLPQGSEVYFRSPTVWEQYRLHILTACAAFFIQTVLVGWLIYEQRRRRLAEVQARNSMAELTQLNRLATAGELSAAIAHEIKQPITGMVAMASAAVRWLSRESPDIGRARDAMGKVVAAGHHVSEIITNVRGLFGKDTQEKTPCDVNKLIRAVLALVYIDLRKNSIETQLNLSEQLPPVIGNEVQLQQVVLNLVMNAIESMFSAAEPRVLSITSKSNEHNTVLVSIADTGSGIGVANLSHIFEPMFTTKARGMGMGLSICKSIIESHNGRIWLSADVPRGSVFHVELPVRRGGEGKSDVSGPTLATLTRSPASAASVPSLSDEN
jgi:signal transduction histidine kinase